MTKWMHEVFQAICNDPRLASIKDKIAIVQGAFMSRVGGGADASDGYHNEAGCIDIRRWSLTEAEVTLFIEVASEYGLQFWRRDEDYAHGHMESHCHGVLGSDSPLSSGATQQVHDLMANPRLDGLANRGHDYEERFTPIRFAPPDELLQEDDMADPATQKVLADILDGVQAAQKRDVALRKLVKAVAEQVSDLADAVSADASTGDDIKARITKSKSEVLSAIDALDQEDPAS